MATTTKKKPAARNRGAMDAVAKKPRITWCDIILDADIADTYDEAKAALDVAEKRLLDTRARRIAAARSALSAGDPEQGNVLATIELEDNDTLAPLRTAEAEARAALEAATQRYKFRALGRAQWKALKDEHPATEDDHAAAREVTGKADAEAEYHFEGLAPALVAAAMVSPTMTLEEVIADIVESEDWNDTEFAQLYQTALVAQVTSRQNPLGTARQ